MREPVVVDEEDDEFSVDRFLYGPRRLVETPQPGTEAPALDDEFSVDRFLYGPGSGNAPQTDTPSLSPLTSPRAATSSLGAPAVHTTPKTAPNPKEGELRRLVGKAREAITTTPRVGLGAAVRRSGGVIPFIGDIEYGIGKNAIDMYYGAAAIMGGLINMGVSLPVGALSKMASSVLGGQPAFPTAERYFEEFPEKAGEFAVRMAEVMIEDVKSFNEDPIGFVQNHSLEVMLDVNGMGALLSRGAGVGMRAAGKAAGRAARAAGKEASVLGEHLIRAADVAAEVRPLRMVAKGTMKGVRAAVRRIEPLDSAWLQASIKRSIDQFSTDSRRVNRVMTAAGTKEATRMFSGLSDRERLAMIPVLEGAASAVNWSDEGLAAMRRWKELAVGPEFENLMVKLNLLDRVDIETAPWDRLRQLLAYEVDGKRIVPSVGEVLDLLGFVDDTNPNLVALRSRVGAEAESASRAAVRSAGATVKTKAPDTARSVPSAGPTADDAAVAAASTRKAEAALAAEDVRSTLAAAREAEDAARAAEDAARAAGAYRRTPEAVGGADASRLLELSRTAKDARNKADAARAAADAAGARAAVHAAREADAARGVSAVGRKAEGTADVERSGASWEEMELARQVPSRGLVTPWVGSVARLEPPPVTWVKPTYVPILMGTELEGHGFFHKWRSMRALRRGALEVPTEGGMVRPQPPSGPAGALTETIVDAELGARRAMESAELRAGELVEQSKTLRPQTLRAPHAELGPSGTYTEPSFLHKRTGRGVLSEKRVTDMQVLAEHAFREKGRLIANASLSKRITDNYGYKIVPGEGGVQIFTSTGVRAFDQVFSSVADAKKKLYEEGIDVQGRRMPAVLFSPKHHVLEQTLGVELLDNLRVNMLKGMDPTTAWAKAVGEISDDMIARYTREADAGVLYAIPKVVADKLEDIAKIESAALKSSGLGGFIDDVNQVSKTLWLSTPRFVLNTVVGNTTMAVMSGTSPRSLVQALMPRYKRLFDDIPEIKMNQYASEIGSDEYLGMSTRTSNRMSSNLPNMLRQDTLLSRFGPSMEKFGRSVDRLVLGGFLKGASAVDEWFRRAAAIQAAKNLTGERKAADIVRLKQMGIDGSIVDDLVTTTERRIAEARATPEMLKSMINHVNYWYFDYFDMPAYQRHWFRRASPFWTWTKKIAELQLKLPLDHPVRTMIGANVLAVMNDATGQEELPLFKKGSVPSGFAEGQRVRGTGSFVFGGNVLKGLLGGESPEVSLHPLIDFALMMGGYAGKYSKQAKDVMETWHRNFRVDRFQGDAVVEETDDTGPTIPQYMVNLFSQVPLLAEFLRNAASEIPDSAVKKYVESVVGKVETGGRETMAGRVESPHRWRRMLGFLGVSVTPDVGPHWDEVRRALEYRTMDQLREWQRQRVERGLTEEPGLLEE